MDRLFCVVLLCMCVIAAGGRMRAQPACFSLIFPQLMPAAGAVFRWPWNWDWNGDLNWTDWAEATPGEAVML